MKRKILILMLFCIALITSSTAFAWPEVFTDDFSTGNLDKWTAADGFVYDAESGGMKIPHWINNGAFPNDVNASKNVSIEFDYTEVTDWTELYVRFKSVDESFFEIRLKDGAIEIDDFNTYETIWTGTQDLTNLNGVKMELLGGTLNIYTKMNDAESYTRIVSTEHSLIDDEKEYLPGFWALTGNEKIVDNVVIRTLPAFEPEFSAETIDTQLGSKIMVSFDNPPTGTVNDDNIWLERGDGTKVSSISKISEGVYELTTNVILSDGETIKVKIANLTDEFGQVITSFEKNIQAIASTSDEVLTWPEAFTDDFSTGDLSKWTVTDAFIYDAESGGMKIPHWTNDGAFPNNVNASKNISIEFDYTEVTDATDVYVRFRSVDESFFDVRLKDNAIEIDDFNTYELIWTGAQDLTNLNSVKMELLDGTLNIYTKTNDAESYTRIVSTEHSLIDDEKEYLPGFWALTANEKIVDNVVIRTLPAFEPEFSAETIDTRPGSKITVSFDNPPTVIVNDDNIWLEKGDGTKISTISKISEGVYELMTNEWLSEAETIKVKIADIENAFGQVITLFERDIKALTYTNDFTLQVMKADGDERIPITDLEQGNQTIAVTLLPNRQAATAADIAIILCKGTEEKYSVSDIYYYNAVSVNSEKSAGITVGAGEFLKVMTFTDFTTGKIAGKTVSIIQAE